MNYNETVLLHEINLKKKYNLTNYSTITFDDGHQSILKNINHIYDQIADKEKIIFIVPSFTMSNYSRDINSKEYYMYDYFINKKSQFLNLDEIYTLIDKYNFKIGGHSYYHDVILTINHNGKKIPKHRQWRNYIIPESIPRNNIFQPKSKLANHGYTIDTSEKIKERSHNDYLEYIEDDTSKLRDWLLKYFSNYITSYAYPFFEESIELNIFLKKYNFTDLYGKRKEV